MGCHNKEKRQRQKKNANWEWKSDGIARIEIYRVFGDDVDDDSNQKAYSINQKTNSCWHFFQRISLHSFCSA